MSARLIASIAIPVGIAAALLLIYHIVTFPVIRPRSIPLEPVYGYRMLAITVLWLASVILSLFSITMQRSKLGYIALVIAGFPLELGLLVVIGSFIL